MMFHTLVPLLLVECLEYDPSPMEPRFPGLLLIELEKAGYKDLVESQKMFEYSS